jgi:peptidoglycan/LPS O-acetylase OafA/YrhL
MNSASRLPVLDGLRAISILLVLAAHMLPMGPKILELNYSAGGMGMSLFFALSGFLITSTLLHNSDVCEFLVKRLARIVPLAYGYALIVFTVVSFDPKAAFWTCTFLLNYLTQYMVVGLNNHFWSLCVEVHFYLAIAFAVLIWRKNAIWIVWPACLIVTALRINEGVYIAIQTHLRADEILAGACVATLYKDSWRDIIRFPSVLTGLAVISWFISSSSFAEWAQYLRPYAAAAVLASFLCHRDTQLAMLLSSRIMRYIAAVSYALYVVHPLTIYGWLNEGSIVERYLLKRPISFLMTFAAAHLSTFYWEQYWMQAGRNWIQARRARLAKLTI